MLYSDLIETKVFLEIDRGDVSEDTKLRLMIQYASSLIDGFLGRKPPEFKSRTEFYGGTATQRLLLKIRPVVTSPVPLVYVDEAAYFGSVSGGFDTSTTALTYGSDYCLEIDQEDGVTSRSGILVRIGGVWPKPVVRRQGYLSPYVGKGYGTIKVVYSAGYSQDTLPDEFRLACNLLVARLRYMMPVGMEVGTESYEKRVIGMVVERRDYLLSPIKHILFPYRNWKF